MTQFPTSPDSSIKRTSSRRPSTVDSSERTSGTESVSKIPSFTKGSPRHSRLPSSIGLKTDRAPRQVSESLTSEDEDEVDFELLGLDSTFLSQEETLSSTGLNRISYNARPSPPQFTSNPPDSEEFFGTEPDLSPVTSSFPPPEKPSAFHLPYPSVYRTSRSASISDTPSIADVPSLSQGSDLSHSSGSLSTSSANSSVPVTPLSSALAEIVDAVAKVAVAPSDRQLSRETSLQSINEDASFDDSSRQSVESEAEKQSLSNFPLPPQNTVRAKQQLPWIKTSLGNISEVEGTRKHDWLRSSTTLQSLRSPNESLSSLDLSLPSRSLKGKSSFDRLSSSDRRASMTPVPQSGGGLARLLSPRRSSSRLDKDAAKAEKEGKELRKQERESVQYLSGLLWSPKSPKSFKSDDKKRKKDLEKEKVRSVAEEAKRRAEGRGFESSVGKRGEKWAVSGVGGL